MRNPYLFYLCPHCFNHSETPGECHGQAMLRCDPGEPGSNRRKPPHAANGQLLSRAPVWFLEAMSAQPMAAQPTNAVLS